MSNQEIEPDYNLNDQGLVLSREGSKEESERTNITKSVSIQNPIAIETIKVKNQILNKLSQISDKQLSEFAIEKINDDLRKCEKRVFFLFTDCSQVYLENMQQTLLDQLYSQEDLQLSKEQTNSVIEKVQKQIEDGLIIIEKQLPKFPKTIQQEISLTKMNAMREIQQKRETLKHRLDQLTEEIVYMKQGDAKLHAAGETSARNDIKYSSLMGDYQSKLPTGKEFYQGAKDYWSVNHEKTKEIQEFVKHIHQEKQERGEQLKRRRILSQQISKQKEDEQTRTEEEKKFEIKRKILQEKKKAIQEITERHIEREKHLKEYQLEQYNQYLKQKPLYILKEEQYKKEVFLPAIEERKRRLSEIRTTRKPKNLESDLIEHQKKYEEMRKQHESERRLKLNSPKTDRNFISYKGKNYEKCELELQHIRIEKQEELEQQKEKYEKLKSYGKKVKEQYQPKIDENKQLELKALIEKISNQNKAIKNHKIQKLRFEADYNSSLQQRKDNITLTNNGEAHHISTGALDAQNASSDIDLRKIGKDYLLFSKKFAQEHRKDKGKETSQADSSTVNSSRTTNNPVKYKNYLRELREKQYQQSQGDDNNNGYSRKPFKPFFDWQKDIGDENLNANEKYERVFMKVQQMDTEARRKEQLLKYNIQSATLETKQGQKDDADQLENIYVSSIKAKLALLQEFVPGD